MEVEAPDIYNSLDVICEGTSNATNMSMVTVEEDKKNTLKVKFDKSIQWNTVFSG